MNIVGEITNVKEERNGFAASIRQKNSLFHVQGHKLKGIKKGDIVYITNLEKKSGILKTTYIATEKSTVSLYPNIYFTPAEISLAKYCKYAPLLSKFFGEKIEDKNNELKFYRGVRNEETSDKISKIAKRYPKELKGKFSYKSMHISKKFGVFFNWILHFGKFPVVFKGNDIKGILLAAGSDMDKYVIINTEKGTMEEKKIKRQELEDIIEMRNSIVQTYFTQSYDDYFKKVADGECSESCPFYKHCSKIKLSKNKNPELSKFLLAFVKQDLKERKLFLKTVIRGENPIRGVLNGLLKEKKLDGKDITYNIRIAHNEPWIKTREKVMISENPPLSRKAFASVEEIGFSNLLLRSEEDILKPNTVTPIDEALPIYRGIYDFLYSSNSSYQFFSNEPSEVIPFQNENYIQNDEEQNEAVSRMLNFNGLFCLTGENGTGKKFVLTKTVANLMKKGGNILVACENKKDETEKCFRKELGRFVGKDKPVKIFSINEKDLYLEEPIFDYAIILLDSEVEKNLLLAIAGKAKNIIFSTPKFIPFEDKIPESNRAKLTTQHRFGEHIQHFLQPMLSEELTPMEEQEMSLTNIDAVSEEFREIVSPDKFVQFISVKGNPKGTNNKWNDAEAIFVTLAVKEFIKGGMEPEKIGIVTPYERQKAYIEKMLVSSDVSKVRVSLPDDSMEKDVIIISFVDSHKIGGSFTNPVKSKITLTRVKNKLILVGNKNIMKTSKLLSKII